MPGKHLARFISSEWSGPEVHLRDVPGSPALIRGRRKSAKTQ